VECGEGTGVVVDIQEVMHSHEVPGLSLVVVRAGEIAYAEGFGVTSAEPENALPVTPDTLFRAGSVTKPLTGTMLMRLVESRLLNLDTSITDYAPYIQFSEKSAAQIVTLRMLLSHTSGLPSDLQYHDRRITKPYRTDLEQYVREKIPLYPLVAPPGKVYFYSNPGINLAAHLAEVVTGQPYIALMDQWLFQPLAMTRTTFDLSTAMTYPLAQGHLLNAEDKAQVKRPYIDNPTEYPCGFAMTTANDLAKFMLFHLNNPSEMHRIQVDRLNGDGYGLTMRTSSYKGLGTVGHNGAIGKFGAIMRMIPDEGFGVAMLFNRAPAFWTAAGEIVNQITDERLGLEDKSVSVPQKFSTPIEGTFMGYEVGLVEINAGQVVINGKRAESVVAGEVDDTYITVDGLACHRCEYTPYQADGEMLRRYVGTYTADIDTWQVRLTDGQLSLYSEDDRVEVLCIPLSPTRFASDFGVVDFEDGALICALAYRFNRTQA
jgi:CubicO group peptidase (beta-lactamase class C family)